MPNVCVYVNSPSYFHLFGITETRLASHISDKAIAIPNYSILRRDPSVQGETGVAVYIHYSVKHITRRRRDLETCDVECIWIEIKQSKSLPLLVGFLYRNPAATFEWYDNFVHMIDKTDIHKSELSF